MIHYLPQNSKKKNFYFAKKTIIKISVVFCAMLIASCSATKKAQKNIENDLSKLKVFQQGFVGFALYDPASKKMLYTYNADHYFTPASNTKLLALYTGLKILGDSVPALKYAIENDKLIIKGTGDPSFLNPELPESNIYTFLKDSEYPIFYAPPIFREKHFGPGWAWDDYDSYYSAEKSDFPIYGSLINIKFETGSLNPIVHPKIFRDSISAIDTKEPKNKYTQREITSNKMEYQRFDRRTDFNQNVPIHYSENTIPKLLSDTLHKNVEIYKGDISKLNFSETAYSIPTDSIYKLMMQVSDNFIAEQILLMSADKISDTLKSSIAMDYMKEKHLKDLPDALQWYDGSGLSRYNLFTPRSMVKLIEKIEREMPKEELFKILSVGGESGTLKNYYKAETPYIYAKTGTLKNNHSLSGFLVTKSGRTLIFSFMNSNYTVPSKNLKEGMTKILEEIRDHY